MGSKPSQPKKNKDSSELKDAKSSKETTKDSKGMKGTKDDRDLHLKNPLLSNPPIIPVNLQPDSEKKKSSFFSRSSKYITNVQCDFRFPVSGTIKSLWTCLDQIYVWPEYSSKVYMMNRTGETTKTVALTTESAIQDVCLSPVDETLWFCCDDKTILQTDMFGQCHTRFSTDHLSSSICATHTSLVVIGMEDTVVMYSYEGEVKHKANNRDLNMYIGSPQKIAECTKTGRLALLFTRTISVVDKTLNLIYRFEGTTLTSFWNFDGKNVTVADDSSVPTGYKSTKDFYSHGLCFDDDGFLLIADFLNRCTIMVDVSGKYQRTLIDDNRNPLGRPLVINVANNGWLWVVYQNFFTKENNIRLIQYKT